MALGHEALGPRHPDTLRSTNNLAVLYWEQGRYGEAEPLLREALEGRREALGPRYPDTLDSTNDLALLYRAQGRDGEAEPLLREALEGHREALGPNHPDALRVQLNVARNLASLGRVVDAVRQLRAMEGSVLVRLGAELLTTETASVRNRLVASQADYQNAALGLALLPGADPDVVGLAASTVLKFKGLQAEEEAHLAHLARRDRDPRARDRHRTRRPAWPACRLVPRCAAARRRPRRAACGPRGVDRPATGERTRAGAGQPRVRPAPAGPRLRPGCRACGPRRLAAARRAARAAPVSAHGFPRRRF